MYNRACRFYKNRGDGVKGYLLTIIIASVCGAVCVMLAWGGFEKYMKYIASLICIALIITPFRDIDVSQIGDELVDEIDKNVIYQDADLDELASDMAERHAEEYISQIVFAEFGINTVYTDIKIDWDNDSPIITSICVALEQKDMDKQASAKDYLMRVLGGEVTVVEG